MTEIKNKQLHAVYNGNETIINSGFTMMSNYVVPVLNRLKVEGIITESALVVMQSIFSFKHTEANPYPTFSKIAKHLGYKEVTVKSAVASIKKAGILGVSKMVDKVTGRTLRNNEYDFTPFFNLVEKFIVEFVQNNNADVKISDLLGVIIKKKKKSTKDFSSIEKVETEVTKTTPSETLQDAPQAIEEEPQPTLPDSILNAISACKIDAEGISAIETAYAMKMLDDSVIISKIFASKESKKFASYFNVCIRKAIENKEKPEDTPAPNNAGQPYYKKSTREDIEPEWWEESQKKKEERPPEPKVIEIHEMTMEQLLEKEEDVDKRLNIIPDHVQSLADKELIEARKLELMKVVNENV